MIQKVVENLDFQAEYIFLVRKNHLLKYQGLSDTLKRITNGFCKIVEVDGLTEGAACTALLSKEYINNQEDLLIANSDQFIIYEKQNFISLKTLTDVDSIVWTFNAVHPKWSFVKTNSRGYMIDKNIRVNNEFYIAPVYNELIQDQKTLVPFYVNKMWGLGTPEDLKSYLKSR
jgi:hypothetical protein